MPDLSPTDSTTWSILQLIALRAPYPDPGQVFVATTNLTDPSTARGRVVDITEDGAVTSVSPDLRWQSVLARGYWQPPPSPPPPDWGEFIDPIYDAVAKKMVDEAVRAAERESTPRKRRRS